MKNCFYIFLLLVTSSSVKASAKDSTINYMLPDSVKAVQFMAEINVKAINSKKEHFAGIKTDMVKLSLEADKKGREIVFEYPKSATIMATGLNVNADEKGEIAFDYNWVINETYKLLIAAATDSAENFSLYTGYIWLPRENKWKLIGTCKIAGQWSTIKNPVVFHTTNRKTGMQIHIGEVWCQRNTGSWKNMSVRTPSEKADNHPAPVINLFPHIDSVQQHQIEIKQIEEAIASGKTDVLKNTEGIYYTILREGTGRLVSVNDTVVAFYKGYLFNDGSIFDQTKDKPATFPLRRLIKGWQVGVPLCKVGGKIKLVIPSDLAYSIRTRAAKIPPNSILVFEIEVVDVKSPQ